MADLSEEQLGALIARLPPPPEGWVEAAVELPRARSAIEGLVELANRDRELREAILADLDQALRGAGVEPRPPLMDSLRARLSEL
jgi:hypothetical protein